MREFKAPRATPVLDGLFQFGTYKKPFERVNLLEVRKPTGSLDFQFYKNLKLKEWQAFQIGNERFFLLIAIYNAKIQRLAEFYFYDKIAEKKYFYKQQSLSHRLRLPVKLMDSTAEYYSSNLRIKVEYSSEGAIKIEASGLKYKDLPEVQAKVEAQLQNGAPQVVCIPFGINRGMYSLKSAIRAGGNITVGKETFELNPLDSFLILDDHKGYYPNPMKYNWCTGAKVIDKKLIAFNFTENQSTDPDKFNENCLWIGEEVYLLPPVKFTKKNGVYSTWYIKDDAGVVNVEFTPEVQNELKKKWPIKVDYYGPFGSFTGNIDSKINVVVDGYWGMGEQKFIGLNFPPRPHPSL